MRSFSLWVTLTMSLVLHGVAWAQSPMPKPASATEVIQKWLVQGAPEEALKVVDAQLRIAPNDPNLQFQRAVIFERMNRLEQAQSIYEALTQTHPELSEPQNNLGVLLARQNQLAEAKQRFEWALQANPHNRMAQENLADIWVRMADAQYRKLRGADPHNLHLQNKVDVLRPLIHKLTESTK